MRHDPKSVSVTASARLSDEDLAAVSGGISRRLHALGSDVGPVPGLVHRYLAPGVKVELNPQPLPPREAFPIY